MSDEWSKAFGNASSGGDEWSKAFGAQHQGNEWGRAFGVIGDVGKKAATTLGTALDFQRNALAKATTGKSDVGEQMTAQFKGSGIASPQERANEPAWWRGINDFAMQTVTDPLTYETLGLGPLAKLGVKGVGSLLEHAPAEVKAVKNLAQDKFTYGGAARRAVGDEKFGQVLGASNRESVVREELGRRLNAHYDAATKGLKPEEKSQVFQALNGERLPEELDPPLRPAVASLRELTNQAFHLKSGAEARAANPTAVHPDFQEFSNVPGHLTMANRRADYLPGIGYREEVSPSRPASSYNMLDPFDPHEQEREAFTVDPEKHQEYEDAFRGMLKSTARQVSAAHLRNELGPLINEPEVRKLFDITHPATGSERESGQVVTDALKKVVDYPKAGIVSLTPRHSFNILNLVANRDLGALPGTIKNTGRLLGAKSPEERFDILKPAIDKGVISQFPDRENIFAKIPAGVRIGGGATAGAIGGAANAGQDADPQTRLTRAFVGAVAGGVGGAALPKWTNMINRVTWDLDDAAKMTLADRIEKAGGSPGQVVNEVRRFLIDYRNISPAAKAAKYVAPFATFRSGIPGATLAGVARNPARAAALNRATGGTFYGGEPPRGQHGAKLYMPTADVGRGLGDPMGYARATMADPLRALLTGAGISKSGSTDYFTYGEQLLPHYDKKGRFHLGFIGQAAAAGIPEARDVLDQLGIGTFSPRGIGETVLQNATGINVK